MGERKEGARPPQPFPKDLHHRESSATVCVVPQILSWLTAAPEPAAFHALARLCHTHCQQNTQHRPPLVCPHHWLVPKRL